MTPEAALERAAALLDLRRPQEAIEHLRRAQAVAPDVPELHAMTGLAYLQLGDFAQALTAAQAAVTHGPEQEWGHRICSVALVRLGHPLQAKQARARGRPARAPRRPPPTSCWRARCRPPAITGARSPPPGTPSSSTRTTPTPTPRSARSCSSRTARTTRSRPTSARSRWTRRTPTRSTTSPSLACARTSATGIGEQFEAAARLDPRLDVARHNLLHTGPAGRSFVYRRVSTAALAYAVITAFTEPASVLFFLLVAVVFETIRAFEVRRLSAPTRQLLTDDRRARRLKPRRWDWLWPFRLRPWWWLLFAGLFRDARRARRRRRAPV